MLPTKISNTENLDNKARLKELNGDFVETNKQTNKQRCNTQHSILCFHLKRTKKQPCTKIFKSEQQKLSF